MKSGYPEHTVIEADLWGRSSVRCLVNGNWILVGGSESFPDDQFSNVVWDHRVLAKPDTIVMEWPKYPEGSY